MSERPQPPVPGVAVEHRTVTARGLRFHVALAGELQAPPLLLLHGWPQHWFVWRKVLPTLADHYRCVMPDLRGLGWSDAPPSGYEKEQLADDVLALMDELGLERVPVIAHDWGGWAAFLIALRAPQRIERLVALNITPPWPPRQRTLRGALDVLRLWYQVLLASPLGPRVAMNQRAMARAMRSDNVTPDAFSDADLAVYTSALAEPARARATQQIYRSFLLRELPGLLRGRYASTPLTVPTLLLFGTADRAIGPSLIDAAVRPGDDLTVEKIAGSGHFIAEEQPRVVAERALAFLGG